MENISKKELIRCLKPLEKIHIKIIGNFEIEILLNNIDLKINEDNLLFTQKESDNKIGFNLNIVRNIVKNQNEIICYLDDEFDTVIQLNSL